MGKSSSLTETHIRRYAPVSLTHDVALPVGSLNHGSYVVTMKRARVQFLKILARRGLEPVMSKNTIFF